MDLKQHRRGTFLWRGLCRGTAWLYALIGHSRLGRFMAGYRRRPASSEPIYPGRTRCRPMSTARLRLVEAVESGRIFSGLRALSHALLVCPTAVYGLFLLFYGLFGVLSYFVLPLVYRPLAPGTASLLASGVIAVAALPLAVTRRSLAETLGRGWLTRLLLVGLLGVPPDRLAAPRRRMPVALPYLSVLLALGAAVGVLLGRLSPAVVPLGCLAVGLCGLIFTYPEAGAVLSTVLLPILWFERNTLFVLVALILLTWCSYLVKLLFLHRTLRLDRLDATVLILGGLMLLSGFTGETVTRETVMRSILLFLCLSDYFLIVNLMTTRALIRRCLIGVGASVVMVTALAYLRLLPVDALFWLEGSRAGNAIIAGFESGMESLSGLWAEHSELFLVLAFPWLYAHLVHTGRLRRRVMGLILLALELLLIIRTDSVSALFCVVMVTVLFVLLLGYKWLAAGVVALPAVTCVALWVTYLYPLSEGVRTVLSRSRLYKSQLWDSLWHMVRDYPAGIGVGEEAFAAIYPAYAAPDLGAVTDSGNLFFEVLLNYGWQGVLVTAVLVFFFLQKGMTALTHTVATKDRAMILGGIASLVGALIFGTVRSFLTAPRVFFTLALVVALCSAYENIIFDESDVLSAGEAGDARRDDRIYRSL